MESKYFTIGQISKLMNVTVKALRFYEKLGLLTPKYIDPQTKYRYYHVSQLIYIDIIKAARNLDISPKALVPYFKNKDSKGLITLIKNHKRILSERIAEMQKTVNGLDVIAGNLDKAERIDTSGTIYKKVIPDRYIVTQSFQHENQYIDMDMEFYRLSILANKKGLKQTYEDGIIYIQKDNEISPECIFVGVLESQGDVSLLAGDEYICTVITQENAQSQIIKLLEYVSRSNLEMEFLIQTEVLTDVFSEKPEYGEIQAKIKSQ